LRFKIDRAIFDFFPELHVGLVRGRDVDNRGDCPEIMARIGKIQKDIRRDFSLANFGENPRIQNWKEAFKAFGAKPKKHLSSVESLYRMILEGKDLRTINKLVDIYNLVSLLHMVPVGGDDLARIDGNIVLRFARGDETFVPLGAGEVQTARRGEVIYADGKEVLCRRWNWRESEKSKMTEQTEDVLLVCEGLPPVTEEDIRRACKDLGRLLKIYCGGEIERAVLGMACGEWEL
jgi:lysyl-tRNA synthetase class 2